MLHRVYWRVKGKMFEAIVESQKVLFDDRATNVGTRCSSTTVDLYCRVSEVIKESLDILSQYNGIVYCAAEVTLNVASCSRHWQVWLQNRFYRLSDPHQKVRGSDKPEVWCYGVRPQVGLGWDHEFLWC